MGQSGATDLLVVTMAPSAADTALKALSRAEARLHPDYGEPPVDARAKADYEAAEWLRWLSGRIRLAQASDVDQGGRPEGAIAETEPSA